MLKRIDYYCCTLPLSSNNRKSILMRQQQYEGKSMFSNKRKSVKAAIKKSKKEFLIRTIEDVSQMKERVRVKNQPVVLGLPRCNSKQYKQQHITRSTSIPLTKLQFEINSYIFRLFMCTRE